MHKGAAGKLTKKADLHKAQDERCSMAHLSNGMLSHLWISSWHNVIAWIVPGNWEESLGSSGNDKANAGQQQQRATRLVQHGVESLMLVLGSTQQETAPCA